ncbi:MAG: MBL fold metallo-hydrolase [Candidatus Tectimicrobiota bacterium]|nr:MAG: MBL fold metallo-hydrolase [Candidatus Tectomicrobia bacterium]
MRLYALTCGHFEIRKRMFIADAEDGETRLRIPVPAFLIVHPQGNVLFDTGLHAQGLADPWGRWGGLNKALVPHLSLDDHILHQLASLGVRAADIRYVANSHLHHDHAGGNAAFPRATFLVQRRELQAVRDPQLVRTVGYFPEDCALEANYQALDGEYDLFGDGALVLFPTPGHTPGHQSLRVTFADGRRLVLTGDACYLRETLFHRRLPKVVWNAPQALQSLEVLFQLQQAPQTLVIPGHDPEVWPTLRHAPAYYA